jgi:dTDP-glucose pyrophosphorylase
MLNILVPMMGASFFEGGEYQYPKPLIEVDGRPLIEHVITCLQSIKQEKRFILIINATDAQKYHLDSVLQLITPKNTIVLQIARETKGAACSALLAIEHINNNEPLIISNSDHVFDIDLNIAIADFKKQDVDAGLICFDSVHPKWSFARLDEHLNVVETAEKRPLSRNAIAGFYYFKRGVDFVEATMKTIEKDASLDGKYYVAPTLNELVLQNKSIRIHTIPSISYKSFYSPHKVQEYEDFLKFKKQTMAHIGEKEK